MSGFPARNDYVASLVPGAATHTFMNSAIGAWSVTKCPAGGYAVARQVPKQHAAAARRPRSPATPQSTQGS